MDSFIVKFLQNGKAMRMEKAGLLETFPNELSSFLMAVKDVHTITIKSPLYGTIIITRE